LYYASLLFYASLLQSALRLSWPGKQERDPILPFIVWRIGKNAHKKQTSANGEMASLCFLPANSNAKHFIAITAAIRVAVVLLCIMHTDRQTFCIDMRILCLLQPRAGCAY
jgi:hypothetical protein